MPSSEELRADHDAEPSDEDCRLMRAISQSDPQALQRLYDRYSPRVFAFCLRSLRNRAEAEDLVIEIFWELWRRQERYDQTRSSPLTYLMKVTRSRVIDRLRSLRSRSSVESSSAASQHGVEDGRAADGGGPLDQMAGAEAGAQVRDALNRLSPDQRKALEMAYFDAMSYSEVADSLGQPLGTVKSRIRQALAQLREMLGKVGV